MTKEEYIASTASAIMAALCASPTFLMVERYDENVAIKAAILLAIRLEETGWAPWISKT